MGSEIAYVDAIEERKEKALQSVSDYDHIALLSDEDRDILKNVAAYDARHNKAYDKTLESIGAELDELEDRSIYRSPRTKQKISQALADKPIFSKTKPTDTKPVSKTRTSLSKTEHQSKLKSITEQRRLKASFEKVVMKYYRGIKKAQLASAPNRRAKEGMRAKFKHFEIGVIRRGVAFGSETFVSEIQNEFSGLNWELAIADSDTKELVSGDNTIQEEAESLVSEAPDVEDFSIETKGPAQLREEAQAGGGDSGNASGKTPDIAGKEKPADKDEKTTSASEVSVKGDVPKKSAEKSSKSEAGGEGKQAAPAAAAALKISKPESTEAKIEVTNTKVQSLEKTSDELNKNSKAQYQKSLDKIANTSSKIKKTKDAGTKSAEATKAVTPPIEEAIGEANTATIEGVASAPTPDTDRQKPKESVTKNITAKLPKTEADVKNLKDSNHAEKAAQEMNALIKDQTGKIKGNYEKIKEKKAPVQKAAEQPLPVPEPAPPISNLDLSEALLPSTNPVQSDFSELSQASDDLIKNELQTPELIKEFESSDAQPMVEARAESKNIKSDADKAPGETQALEQTTQSEFKQNLDTEEKTTVDQMLKDREQELKNVEGLQKDSKTKHEEERKKVSDHINKIYETANSRISDKLELLEIKSTKAFEVGQKSAFDRFQKGIETDLEAFFEERHAGVSGFFTSIGDWWSGTDDLPEVQEIFTNNKEIFVATIGQLIDTITAESEQVINECTEILADSREEIATYVEGLSPALQKHGQTCQTDINQKLDKLKEKTAKAETALKDKLAELREQAIAQVDEHIEAQKAKMQSQLSAFGNMVLDLAMKFFTYTLTAMGMDPAQIMEMLNKGVKTLTSIITNPLGFFSNLAGAVGQGIKGFQANFKQHIMGGMLEWLTGAVGGSVEIPQTLGLKDMIRMGFSILGLTWGNLRVKLVKQVGEPVMGAAEKGFELVNVVREDGVSGLWEHIQEEAATIKENVVEGIKSWALTTIVKNAVIQLALMLNPAGAIVKAIISIYDLVMWLVNNIQRIISFVTSIVDSIVSIAAGQVGAAAGFIEGAMAKTIPMILSGLAQFLRLGGISKKIQQVVKKVRAPIDKAVDKGITFVAKKAKKWFGKKKNKPDSKKQQKEDDKKDEQDEKNGKVVKLKPETFKMAGTKHTLTFENDKVMMASVKGDLLMKLRNAQDEVEDNRDAENLKGKAEHVIKSLKGLGSAVSNTTKSLVSAVKSKDTKKMVKAQGSLDKLAANIGKFGSKYGLKDLTDIVTEGEDSKVAATVLHAGSVKSYGEAKLVEKREGTQVKGYRAATKKNSDKPDGITIASQEGNKYSKKREEEKDFKEKFTELYPLSPADRRKKIDAGGTHNQYRPDPSTVKTDITDGVFTLSYDYLPLKDGEKPASFKASVSMDEGQLMTHVITGFGLSLKDKGTRGTITVESSGQGDTHRSHLLADWFRGSGYKSALNIINASSTYNTGPMKTAEEKIENGVSEIINASSGKHITFNMTVDAKYRMLTKVTTINAIEKHLKEGEKDEVYKILQNNKDPRKTEQIDYLANAFKADGESISGMAVADAGEDEWI